jgi:hypothetical protein
MATPDLGCSTASTGQEQCVDWSAIIAQTGQLKKTATATQQLPREHAAGQLPDIMLEQQRRFEHNATWRSQQLSKDAANKPADKRSIEHWFSQNADYGAFQASNGSTTGSNSGVFVVSASGGNGSSSVPDAILIAGTTRQPKDFTLHDLRMSVLTLAVAVAAATLLQGLTVGAWRLARLNPDNLPM